MKNLFGTVRIATTLLLTIGLAAVPVPSYAADEISDGQWFHAFLNTAEAHLTSSGAGVRVAVLDSGVDAKHPDLRGSVLPGKDFITADGNGQTDVQGHGTAMAGLIAAHGRVDGIAPDAKLLPVRFTQYDRGDSALLGKAVQWATSQGVDIISISIGMSRDDLLLREAVQEALAKGIVIVAAAGNTPEATAIEYPAAYPGVIAVGCVDRNGVHASVSVKSQRIDIVAPCVDVTSTDARGLWSVGTGTSSATAIVAGAAALLRAAYPDLPAAEIVHRLMVTALDKGPGGRDPQYGYGVLDLVAALKADVSPLPSPEANTPEEPEEAAPSGSRPWLLALGVVVILAVLVLVVRSRRRR